MKTHPRNYIVLHPAKSANPLGWSVGRRARVGTQQARGSLGPRKPKAYATTEWWRCRDVPSGPLLLHRCTRPSRGPPRSLAVVPSIRIEGTTARLRGGYGGVSGRKGKLLPSLPRKQRRANRQVWALC